MTEKRFKLVEYLPNVIRIEDNHQKLNGHKIVDLLNELHEENQDLKFFNKDLAENLSACANARISKDNWIEKLTEENEQLKQQNENLLVKLKFTAEQVNYSENIKKMLDGDVE